MKIQNQVNSRDSHPEKESRGGSVYRFIKQHSEKERLSYFGAKLVQNDIRGQNILGL